MTPEISGESFTVKINQHYPGIYQNIVMPFAGQGGNFLCGHGDMTVGLDDSVHKTFFGSVSPAK
jgi:hypothetical protein